MKQNTIGIALAAAAIGLYYFSKASAGAKLQIVASNARNLKISGLALEFDLEMSISNPTNQNISINGIGGFCYLNNTVLATTASNTATTIERYSTTKILIPTRVQLTSAIYATQEIINFIKGTAITLAWRGQARALGVSIPLETSFVINRKTAIV